MCERRTEDDVTNYMMMKVMRDVDVCGQREINGLRKDLDVTILVRPLEI